MIFVLDNFDSFTYNIVQYLQQLGCEVVVRRNNAVTVDEVIAMNPEAMSVPFSWRASLTLLSLLRVLTNHEIAPPTNIGILRSNGINMPSAKASAGTFRKFRIMAMTAPMPYMSQGAFPPFIIGSMTAAMALA